MKYICIVWLTALTALLTSCLESGGGGGSSSSVAAPAPESGAPDNGAPAPAQPVAPPVVTPVASALNVSYAVRYGNFSVVITGTDLDIIDDVRLHDYTCVITSQSATQISCTMGTLGSGAGIPVVSEPFYLNDLDSNGNIITQVYSPNINLVDPASLVLSMPVPLDFAGVNTTRSYTVIVTNTSASVSAAIGTFTFGSPGHAIVSHNCGSSIAPASSCQYNMTYTGPSTPQTNVNNGLRYDYNNGAFGTFVSTGGLTTVVDQVATKAYPLDDLCVVYTTGSLKCSGISSSTVKEAYFESKAVEIQRFASGSWLVLLENGKLLKVSTADLSIQATIATNARALSPTNKSWYINSSNILYKINPDLSLTALTLKDSTNAAFGIYSNVVFTGACIKNYNQILCPYSESSGIVTGLLFNFTFGTTDYYASGYTIPNTAGGVSSCFADKNIYSGNVVNNAYCYDPVLNMVNFYNNAPMAMAGDQNNHYRINFTGSAGNTSSAGQIEAWTGSGASQSVITPFDPNFTSQYSSYGSLVFAGQSSVCTVWWNATSIIRCQGTYANNLYGTALTVVNGY